MLWFASLAAVAAAGTAFGRAAFRRTDGPGRRRRPVWAVVGGAGVAGAALLWPGTFYVEKSLTRLALPTGLVWLSLLGLTGWLAYLRRWPGAAAAGCAAALFTLAGNPVAAHAAAQSLQRAFAADPFGAGEFDVVCVLGGGVSLGPHGRPAANAHGDRAVLAAQLFHAGRTPRLLAAGTAPPTGPGPGPGAATKLLWEQLAVPPDRIALIAGTTTHEELTRLAAAARAAKSRGRGWGRIGLVSSAWHLPRAMRLAGAAGLTGQPGCEIVPLPADYAGVLSTTAPLWIPESEALATTDRCLKEWLARLVAR